MYFLKTKGTTQIPDFIQVRDDEMALIAHLGINRLKENLQNIFLETEIEKAYNLLNNLDYGILIEIK